MQADLPVERHDEAEHFAARRGDHELAQEDRRRDLGDGDGAKHVADGPDQQRQQPLAPVVHLKVGNASQ